MAQQKGKENTTADGQVILEETIDENYEPTKQEIHEYAQWLGMDIEKEADLLWIAKEGLKAPLPKPWKPCKTPEGDIYYFNFGTGESIWDHPCDKQYRELYQKEKEKWLQKKSDNPGAASNPQTPTKSNAVATSATANKQPADAKSAGNSKASDINMTGGNALSTSGGLSTSGNLNGNAGNAKKAANVGKLVPLAHSGSPSNSASGSDWPTFSTLGGTKPKLGQPPAIAAANTNTVGSGVTNATVSNANAAVSSSVTAQAIPVTTITNKTADAPTVGNAVAATAIGTSIHLGSKAVAGNSNLTASNTVTSAAVNNVQTKDSTAQMAGRSTVSTPATATATAVSTPMNTSTTFTAVSTDSRAYTLSEYESEKSEVEERQRERMREFKQLLAEQEQIARKRLEEGSEAVLAEARRTFEAREARVKEELALAQQKQISELEQAHQDRLATMRKDHNEAESKLAAQVAATMKQLAEQSAVSNADKAAARTAAETAMKQEATAWADAQRVQYRQQLLEKMHSEVEEEVRPLKASRVEDALKVVDAQVESGVLARKQEMTSLTDQVADQRKLLAELESQTSIKRGALQGLQADEQACNEKLARVQAELGLKQREVASLDHDITNKTSEFDSVLANVMAKQKELSETDSKLAQCKQEVTSATAELSQAQQELTNIRAAAAAEAEARSQAATDSAVNTAALAETCTKLQAERAALEDVSQSLAAKQSELAAVCADLAKARAGILTQDVTLAGQLRSQAGTEFQEKEAELNRARAELAVVAPELAAKQAELMTCQNSLLSVTTELVDKQRRLAQATAELSSVQAELGSINAQLAAKRQQYDTISQLLVAQQRCGPTNDTAARQLGPSNSQRSIGGATDSSRVHGHVANTAAAPAFVAAHAPSMHMMMPGAGTGTQRTDPVIARSLQLLMNQATALDPASMLRYDGSSEDVGVPQPLSPGSAWRSHDIMHPASVAATGRRRSTWTDSELSSAYIPQVKRHHMPQAMAGAGDVFGAAASLRQQLQQDIEAAGNDPLRCEHILKQAKSLLKQQRRALRDSQDGIQAAISEWRQSVALLETEHDSATKKQHTRLLKSMKAVLEDQAHRTNAEHAALSELKQQIRQLEAQQALRLLESSRRTTKAHHPHNSSVNRTLHSSLNQISRALQDAIAATTADNACSSESVPERRWRSTERAGRRSASIPVAWDDGTSESRRTWSRSRQRSRPNPGMLYCGVSNGMMDAPWGSSKSKAGAGLAGLFPASTRAASPSNSVAQTASAAPVQLDIGNNQIIELHVRSKQ